MVENGVHETILLIDASKCTGGGLCVDICPTGALQLVDDCAVLLRPNDCTACALCEDICPTGAIGSRVWHPVFVPELCNGCELCVDICGPQGLKMVSGTPQLLEPEACQSCHECEDICPTGAIHLEPFPREG